MVPATAASRVATSAKTGHTTRHVGYALGQRIRERIEEERVAHEAELRLLARPLAVVKACVSFKGDNVSYGDKSKTP